MVVCECCMKKCLSYILNYSNDEEHGFQFLCRLSSANVKGFDCGDKAAAWLSHAVIEGQVQQEKIGIRLLYNGDLTRARKASEPPYYSFPQYKSSDRVSGKCDMTAWSE